MSGFLEEMARSSRERVRSARSVRPEAALEREARASARPPPLRLDPSGFDLIAEVKLRSPAAGTLAGPGEDLPARLRAYAGAGAASVSVLTEPSRFAGSLEHLAAAARLLAPLGVPVMRKDFLVEPYQLLEARAAGAGGVLLIVRMLSRADLDALIACARSLGLFVLLEAFDARDLELVGALIGAHGATAHDAAAEGAGAALLAGVNCRDLTTLEVTPGRLLELAPLLPAGAPRVAESGVGSADDVRQVAAAGYQLALVGSALMRGGDPRELAAALLAAGRAGGRIS